ncbi:MAG: PilZ domain-containing protein [Pseudomonadota bacterium]
MQAAQVISFYQNDNATNSRFEERRGASRRKVLKGAVAAFSGRSITVPCMVKDISQSGVRIRALGNVNIPDQFVLTIDLDGLEADCEVVWRNDKELGARFIGAARKIGSKRKQSICVNAPTTARSILRRPLTLNAD